ncbi:hypothetical protein ATO6_05770 [Oceanicola sp. 22II-s10i]|uniref:gamma-glutamylcyclotransferase family protein n=1 Tax=Oceanicola sp. 22II-s10i TaxID=1317116 RepID=UPI000B5221C7|nr:gamma-glutamylcyclotransferase family protein [Oceanicola sp. 22II-s10i]OWU86331.1 hypothetical protein ATO6_05770 [Oceanicola sp. 22II-s10i]
MTGDPCFFGYGSLVNRKTHTYPNARPAVAHGWRRMWRHMQTRQVAVLTGVPAPGSEIEGLVAAVPGADWHALDQREAAYDRVLTRDVADDGGASELAIYWIPETKHRLTDAPRPILLSYLDVCVQGYLTEFGEDGVQRFFDTTENWGPIRDDRAAPVYPRHQQLTGAERDLVDGHIARLGLDRLGPSG